MKTIQVIYIKQLLGDQPWHTYELWLLRILLWLIERTNDEEVTREKDPMACS